MWWTGEVKNIAKRYNLLYMWLKVEQARNCIEQDISLLHNFLYSMYIYVEITFSTIAKSVALGKFIPSHQSPNNMTMKNCEAWVTYLLITWILQNSQNILFNNDNTMLETMQYCI